MSGCFLYGYGPCRGQLTGEHYISASVLRATGATSTVKIGGLAWQRADLIQSIGINSLVSNILCDGHNSGLSNLDAIAGNLFRTLDFMDKNRESVQPLTQFDGISIETWLLKVLFGISASGGFHAKPPPDTWKELLTGAQWPDLWGLYVFQPPTSEAFSGDLLIETKTNPMTNEILGASFRVAGVTFNLLLGKPDYPQAFGMHRPRGLIFHHGREERRIEFLWPFDTYDAVVYTHVGTTPTQPAYYEGWKEE